MAQKHSPEIPLYMQIHARLQQRILGGEWGYGAMLPSEHELCAEYGISRGTMRQVQADVDLQIEGDFVSLFWHHKYFLILTCRR